jgi:hypothetical protein
MTTSPAPRSPANTFVQRITINPDGRTDKQTAKARIDTLTTAVRSVDRDRPITLGEIPWSEVFKGAESLFHESDVGGAPDFVGIHIYSQAHRARRIPRRAARLLDRQG